MPHPNNHNLAINLPRGARVPDIPSPIDSWNPYLHSTNTPDDAPFRPYAESDTSRLRVPKKRPSRSASASTPGSPMTEASSAFPEPPLPRSPSYASSLVRMHRYTKSEAPHAVYRRESLDFSIEVCVFRSLYLCYTPDSSLLVHAFFNTFRCPHSLRRAFKPVVCCSNLLQFLLMD
jgi:hypothetical protein